MTFHEDAQRFVDAWHECEARGQCDGLGGAEFTRVCREWFAAGAPPDVHEFIRRRANMMPWDDTAATTPPEPLTRKEASNGEA